MRVGLRDIFASIPQFIIAKPTYPRRLLFNAGRILLRAVFFYFGRENFNLHPRLQG